MTRQRIDHRLNRLAERLDQAARIKPNLDHHLAQQLAYCNTQTYNETGISAPGTLNDPVIAGIMARERIMSHSNQVERCVVELEAGLNALDQAMRAAWGRERPADTPATTDLCIGDGYTGAECSRVADERRVNGIVVNDGRCLEHGHTYDQRKADESNARRARRYREAS